LGLIAIRKLTQGITKNQCIKYVFAINNVKADPAGKAGPTLLRLLAFFKAKALRLKVDIDNGHSNGNWRQAKAAIRSP
jgi:hypothetical protein